METMKIDGLTLFFAADEREAAELVGQACAKTIRLVRERWGLDPPQDCRVYVMTSWLQFMFHSAPWPWRILMGASMPLWYGRVRKLWRHAGGWMQPYGKRRVVGIKPPRLIQLGDRGLGDRIFNREKSADEKVLHITCHELVHACTAHLKPPMWLNEGLAMVTVDSFFSEPTVRRETLETLEGSSHARRAGSARRFTLKDHDAAVYLYVRGYWLTRYIEETQPGLLQRLLPQRLDHTGLESALASAYDMSHEQFWSSADMIVASHFRPLDCEEQPGVTHVS